jgi:mono/diheme cytochrome c family protein
MTLDRCRACKLVPALARVAFLRSGSIVGGAAVAFCAAVLTLAPAWRDAAAQPGGNAAAGPVFTAEQVARGEAAYRRACQDCHGSELDNGEFGGPPLKGPDFDSHWGAGNVAALYNFTKALMPPDRPGDLSPQTYVDLTAFILSNNGYKPSDKELPADLDALGRMNLRK